MSITVMKQALEAIATGRGKFEAITALRQAIEQAEKVEHNAACAAPVQEPVQEPVANASAWFALVMNAAAELEDASHCLRDEDAKRLAISGAKHYRDAAKALYATPSAAPAQEPTRAQTMQIIDGLQHCHHRDSQHEFLRTWIRDWTTHKTAPAQPAVSPDLSRLEPFVHGLGKAILREIQAAPAQPAVPPAKFVPDPAFEGDVDEATYASGWNDCRNAMLSAAPAQQPLSVLQIERIYDEVPEYQPDGSWWIVALARAIEQAHGIKGASL